MRARGHGAGRVGRWRMLRAAPAALALLGCATTADPVLRRPGRPEAVTEALARSAAPAPGPGNRSGRPLALLVSRAGGDRDRPGPVRRVLAVDLGTRRVRFSVEVELDGRLELARDVAVYSREDGSLAALGLDDGRVRWQYRPPAGARLSGYAADGDGVFAVYRGSGSGGPPGELVGMRADSGRVRFRVPLSDRVGAPAARGGVVAVPQRSQFVTLYDGESGKVLADILSREEAAQFVRALPEGVFFGSQGVFWASGETAQGARQVPGYLRAQLPDFVRSVYHQDAYQPALVRYSAVDRNRLHWRAERVGGRPGFRDDLVVVHHFRFLFGLRASTGELRWVYSHPEVDLVGAAHTGPAIVFADARGRLGAVGTATGELLSLGAPLDAAGGELPVPPVEGVTFDADGFAAAGPGARPATPLLTALEALALDPDRRLSDVRLFAVDRLAALRLPGTTAALLAILDRLDVEEPARQAAAEALVALQDPAALETYARAVARRTDFAEGTRVEGLELMARALARLGARDAMPALADHLRRPETDPNLVRDIADAVLAVRATECLPAFRDYLSLYRADAYFLARPGALLAAAEVLAALGGPRERAYLAFVAYDESTLPALRTAIARLLAGDGRLR